MGSACKQLVKGGAGARQARATSEANQILAAPAGTLSEADGTQARAWSCHSERQREGSEGRGRGRLMQNWASTPF